MARPWQRYRRERLAHAANPRRLIGSVVVAAATLTALLSFPAHAETVPAPVRRTADPWRSFIDEAAARFAIPASRIRAVIRAESGGDSRAVSPKGAVGPMQLMPDTYAELRARFGLGDDPAEPHDNIIAGTAYLRDMYDRFGATGFLAAYNAGPERYRHHLATGRLLPDETLTYIAKLVPLLSGGPADSVSAAVPTPSAWQQSPLFVEHRPSFSADASSTFASRSAFKVSGRSIADLSALVPLPGSLFVRKPGSRATP